MSIKCLPLLGALAIGFPAFGATTSMAAFTCAASVSDASDAGRNDQGVAGQYFGATGGTPGAGASFMAYCAESRQDVIAPTPIVEPSTWGLLAAGLGVVGLMAQRRRR